MEEHRTYAVPVTIGMLLVLPWCFRVESGRAREQSTIALALALPSMHSGR